MNRMILFLAVLTVGCQGTVDSPEQSMSASPVSGIQSDQGEAWYARNGDDTMLVFGHHDENWNNHVLMTSTRTEDGWSDASVLPFSGEYNDRGARFYPALDALIFASDRPLPSEMEAGDFNIWVVVHDGESWLDPEPMSTLNTDGNDFHASGSADGTIYFASDREGSLGRSDLYRAELGSLGYEVSPLGEPVNSAYSESDVFVDADQRFVIFSRTDDPAGLGGDDLWISFRENEQWSQPANLGTEVNSAEYEYAASLSRDGSTLYFTSHQSGNADIMEIPVTSLAVEWPWEMASADE